MTAPITGSIQSTLTNSGLVNTPFDVNYTSIQTALHQSHFDNAVTLESIRKSSVTYNIAGSATGIGDEFILSTKTGTYDSGEFTLSGSIHTLLPKDGIYEIVGGMTITDSNTSTSLINPGISIYKNDAPLIDYAGGRKSADVSTPIAISINGTFEANSGDAISIVSDESTTLACIIDACTVTLKRIS